MRPLLLNLAVTLDGFIEGPNGEIDWCLADQDYGLTPFLARCDAAIMGRRSYDSLLQMGPDPWPEKRKYIYSRTLKTSGENTEIRSGDLAQDVAALKRFEGKGIWLFGGADIIGQCLRAGLVDELHLSIHPVILGGGRRLFEEASERTSLRMLRTDTFSTGLVQIQYALGDPSK